MIFLLLNSFMPAINAQIEKETRLLNGVEIF